MCLARLPLFAKFGRGKSEFAKFEAIAGFSMRCV